MTTPLDIVIVSKEDFLSAKERVLGSPPCEKLQRLYASLFKDYECFTKSEQSFGSITQSHNNNNQGHFNPSHGKFSAKTSNSSHNNSYVHGGYKSQHQHKGSGGHSFHANNYHKSMSNYGSRSTPSKPITKVFDATLTNDPMGDVKKKLKGFLNIINNNNYKKITTKIKALLTNENAKTVYETILVNTCNQVFYVNVFITLIMDLINHAPSTQDVCVTVVNEFIENFIYMKEYVMVVDQNADPSKEYDAFCAQQKHKSMITSKNLVIVEFLKKCFSKKWTVQSYADGLLGTLDELHAANMPNQPINASMETNTDIMLTLLKDLKGVDKKIKLNTYVISKVLAFGYNQRITFMSQDIINMEWN
jgi:hypothetical protein